MLCAQAPVTLHKKKARTAAGTIAGTILVGPIGSMQHSGGGWKTPCLTNAGRPQSVQSIYCAAARPENPLVAE
jgi:hypothetical protein